MDWIDLPEAKDNCRALAKAAMNFRLPQASRGNVGFKKRLLPKRRREIHLAHRAKTLKPKNQ
jgi:hypothetical protein